MEGYHPDWLGRGLIDEDLPWDRAVGVPMPRFLSEYTLHDSGWIGVYLQPNFEAVALLRWDTFWTEGRVFYPGPIVADWPLMLVRFERVYQVFTTYPTAEERGAFDSLPEIVSGTESAIVSPAEREALLDTVLRKRQKVDAFSDFLLDDRLHRTTISPVHRSWVGIWHGVNTRFLCLDREGEALPIPGLP